MKQGTSTQRTKASNPFAVKKRHNVPAPPTDTTRMLESLLDGKSVHKKKKIVAKTPKIEKHPALPIQAPHKHRVPSEPVFKSGSLSDAKTYQPSKTNLVSNPPKRKKKTAMLKLQPIRSKIPEIGHISVKGAISLNGAPEKESSKPSLPTEPTLVATTNVSATPAVISAPKASSLSLNIQRPKKRSLGFSMNLPPKRQQLDPITTLKSTTIANASAMGRLPSSSNNETSLKQHIPPPADASSTKPVECPVHIPKSQQPSAAKIRQLNPEKAIPASVGMEQLYSSSSSSKISLISQPKAGQAKSFAKKPLAGFSSMPPPVSKSLPQFNQKRRVAGNDNFVRQNLKNNGGSCRGGKGKKNDKWNRGKYGDASKSSMRSKHPRKANIDAMDDYLDGTFHAGDVGNTKKVDDKNTEKVKEGGTAPCCSGHQRPCKLLVVKKSGGNKGKKFYVCTLPRGEQCDFFEWKDNSTEAAKEVLLKKSSYSGFVARQVSSYVARFQVLTVPELRLEAKQRQLSSLGKKRELLMRLSLFVRDQLADSEKQDAEEVHVQATVHADDEVQDDSSASSEELEISGGRDDDEFLVGDSLKTEDDPLDNSDDDQQEKKLLPKVPELSKESSVQDTLLQLFGHSHFREGQEWAVERCMSQKRSLLVAPTGFGKSLCYALPAALLTGTCIVVSPLISLIEDQLRQLPPKIPAATLSGGMTASALACTIDDVIKNRIKILYVSPERLATPSFRRLFKLRWDQEKQVRERRFPPVSLLCIDEAHCISQWGHNFRPSYLRIRSLLECIQPQSVLAVTATAGPPIVRDICRYLQIPDETQATAESGTGVKILKNDRDNIDVFCKIMDNTESRLHLIQTLLLAPPKKSASVSKHQAISDGCLAKSNVIVYVWRQRDAEVVAESLSETGVEGGVVVYHGGMDAKARSSAQSRFLRGKARVCVATVAFGMGVNKIDIDAVVHLNLPSSLEHYLQEIGRAGRDGRQARAISLPVTDEVEYRHSLAHSNLIAESQVLLLLRMLDAQVKQVRDDLELTVSSSGQHRVFVGMKVDMSMRALDCKIETIETLLSLMEGDEVCPTFLSFEGRVNDLVTVVLKRSSLEQLEVREQVAKCISKCGRKLEQGKQTGVDGEEDMSYAVRKVTSRSCGIESYEFSVSRCTNLMGPTAEPRHVYAALRRLQNLGEVELVFDSKGYALQVQVDIAGFTDIEMGKTLWRRFSNQIQTTAAKVKKIDGILREVASVEDDKDSDGPKSARLLKFQELATKELSECGNPAIDPKDSLPKASQELIYDARSAVHHLRDVMLQAEKVDDGIHVVHFDHCDFMDYTALTVAKFLHGIDGKRTSSFAQQHVLHGRWRHIDFETTRAHVYNSLKSGD